MTSQSPRFAWLILLIASVSVIPAAARAQIVTQPVPPVATPGQPDPDLQLVPAEPEFTLAALPTTLRMPTRKFGFRMTHRFARPIGAGNVGDFFSNFFGFDGGAKIGIEVRYGVRPGTQVTFHRTSDRTIQLLGQHELVQQSDTRPFTAGVLAAIEGRNNFGLSDSLDVEGTKQFSATLGAVASRRFDEHGAAYATPFVVFNANLLPTPDNDNQHTLMLGLGGRLRLGTSRVYLVGEVVPRLAGYDAGVDHISVGIERRAGGHIFQLNFSNSLATTMGQIARGGPGNDDWYIGFNLTRRFF